MSIRLLLLGIVWLHIAMVAVVALQMEITPGETKVSSTTNYARYK
jgi:hypothetical protein